MTRAADVTLRFTADISKVRSQISGLGTSIQKTGKKTKRSFKSANREVSRFGSNTKKVGKQTSKLAQAMGGLNSATQLFKGLALYRLFGAGTKIVKDAVRAQLEFNKAIAEANSLISGSASTVRFLNDELLSLSRNVPQSPKDLGGGVYTILSAGILDSADAAATLEVAAKSAAAGLTDTETAAETMVSVMNAYGLETDQATRVSDLLFTTVKRGILRFEDLNSALGTISPVAAAFNVRMEEMFAALQTMTKGGLNARRSATALRQTIQNIAAPSRKATEIAEEFGIELGGAALATKGLIGFMQDFSERMGTLNPKAQKVIAAMNEGTISFEQAQGALKEMGGTAGVVAEIFTSRRGLMGAVLLGGKRLGEFRENLEATEDSTGAMGEAFERATDNVIDQAKIAANQMAVAFDRVDDILMDVTGGLQDFASFLADHKDTVQGFVGGILGLVGALTAMKATTFVVGLVGNLVTQFQTMASVIRIANIQQTQFAVQSVSSGQMLGSWTGAVASAKGAVLGFTATLSMALASIGFMASSIIAARDGTSKWTTALNLLSSGLIGVSVGIKAVQASLVAGPLGALLIGGAAAGLTFFGFQKMTDMMDTTISKAEEWQDTLSGTAEEVEEKVFDTISKASEDGKEAFITALEDMEDRFREFLATTGTISEGGLAVGEELSKNLARDFFGENVDPRARFQPGNLGGFDNQRVQATVNRAVSEARRGISGRFNSVLNSASDRIEETTRLMILQQHSREELLKMSKDEIKALREETRARVEAATMAGIVADEFDISRRAAKGLIAAHLNAGGTIRNFASAVNLTTTATGKLGVTVEGATENLDDLLSEFGNAADTIEDIISPENLLGPGVDDFIDKVLKVTSDFENLSQQTQDMIKKLEKVQKLVSALEFINLLRNLEFGELFTAGLDAQNQLLETLVNQGDETNRLLANAPGSRGPTPEIPTTGGMTQSEMVENLLNTSLPGPGGGGSTGGGSGGPIIDTPAEVIFGPIPGVIGSPVPLPSGAAPDDPLANLFPGNKKGGIIPSFANGGVTPGSASSPVPAMLHGGELVIPAGMTKKLAGLFGKGGMSFQGGGQIPEVLQPAVNVIRNAAPSAVVSTFKRGRTGISLAANGKPVPLAALSALGLMGRGVPESGISRRDLGMAKQFLSSVSSGNFGGGGGGGGGSGGGGGGFDFGEQFTGGQGQIAELIRFTFEESGLLGEGPLEELFTTGSLKEIISLFFREAPEDIATVTERVSDIAGSLSTWKEALEVAKRDWLQIQGKMSGLGITFDNVRGGLEAISEINIQKTALTLLEDLKNIQTAVGSETITGLDSAIAEVQQTILSEGQSFLQELVTDDPAALAEALARQMNIEQNVDNSTNNNIVIRMTGNVGRDEAEFADRVLAELNQRLREQGQGVRQ